MGSFFILRSPFNKTRTAYICLAPLRHCWIPGQPYHMELTAEQASRISPNVYPAGVKKPVGSFPLYPCPAKYALSQNNYSKYTE